MEIFNIFSACSSQTPPYASSLAVVAKVSNFSMLKTNDATCVEHNLSNKTGNELAIASCHQRESAAVTHTGSTSWSWALRSSHYTELFSIPWKLSLALDRKRFMFQELRSLNAYLVHAASLPTQPLHYSIVSYSSSEWRNTSWVQWYGHRTGVCQSRGAYLTLCRLFAYPHSQNTQDLGMRL